MGFRGRSPAWVSLANRTTGLFVLWVVAILLLKHKQAVEEQDKLLHRLQEALAKVRTLKGLLLLCSSCQKVRDDRGDWKELTAYVRTNSEADFRPDLCPSCGELMFPDFYRGASQRLH